MVGTCPVCDLPATVAQQNQSEAASPSHSAAQRPPTPHPISGPGRSLLAGLFLLLEHSMCSICIISHHCTAGRQYAPPRLHAVAPANHICSAAHCLLAAILPVITLLRSRIQSRPAAARPADHHILPPLFSSGANVFLLPSLNVVKNPKVDGGPVPPRE